LPICVSARGLCTGGTGRENSRVWRGPGQEHCPRTILNHQSHRGLCIDVGEGAAKVRPRGPSQIQKCSLDRKSPARHRACPDWH
jgi:hypothetical protein